MIIIKQPHPLDMVWRDLPEIVGDAFDAIESLPDGTPNEEVDRAVDAAVEKLEAMLALPARGVEDILAKLDLLHAPGGPRTNFDMQVLIEEFCNVVNAGLQAGKSLQASAKLPQPEVATITPDAEAHEAWEDFRAKTATFMQAAARGEQSIAQFLAMEQAREHLTALLIKPKRRAEAA